MTDDSPIRDDELPGLFGWLGDHLTPANTLGLAVSGGADFMALLHLMAAWANMGGLPAGNASGSVHIKVLSVDHGLRPEAADEVAFAKREAEALGFSHQTLRWGGEKPQTGIQAAARQARYALMAEALAEPGWLDRVERGELPRDLFLVTAHHQDDQAETVLMRLARGSGIDGLAGMARVSRPGGFEHTTGPVAQFTILRPLLDVPKARLTATLRARCLNWIDDPSNEDTEYERVRLRQGTGARAAMGLANDMIALSAARLAKERDGLDEAVYALTENVVTTPGADGVITGNLERLLADWPVPTARTVKLRMLRNLLAAQGGQPYPPPPAQVESMLAWLVANRQAPKNAMTLAGCMVEIFGAGSAGQPEGMPNCQFRIFRELGRSGLPQLTLTRGRSAVWDRRFLVWLPSQFEGPMQVRALTGAEWAALKASHPCLKSCGVFARAATTAPGYWQNGTLVAHPLLSQYEPALASKGAGKEARLLIHFIHLPRLSGR